MGEVVFSVQNVYLHMLLFNLECPTVTGELERNRNSLTLADRCSSGKNELERQMLMGVSLCWAENYVLFQHR